MDIPVFLHTDGEQIINEMVASYEDATGEILKPAQLERLMINVIAYREVVIRSQVNEAALSNLLAFSRAPVIDFLGQLVGVSRLLATSAGCTLKMTFEEGHGELVIASGIRVQSEDGLAIFITESDIILEEGVNEYEVAASATIAGKSGNGYAVGKIVNILDPQPYLLSATNLDVTSGGADEEDDDGLRERIRLAPSAFSNAGSEGSYKYFAKSANPGISDISIPNPTPVPGEVHIYVLMENGVIPGPEVLEQVYNTCNADKVRPLTDTVLVYAPEIIEYEINVDLTLLTGSIASEIQDRVSDILEDFANERKQRIGLDIVRSKINQLVMSVPGMYDVDIISPAASITVNYNKVAVCTGVTVTIGGYSDE